MNTTKNLYLDQEVTPEEDEAWENFLVKFAYNPLRQENLETTIPMEKKDGLLGTSN